MKNEINGMVYYHEIDKWVTKEEYDDFVAKKLQQKIAEDLYYNYVSEFDEWLHKLAETNGVTNY